MADIQDLNEFISLVSVGENDPPVAVGSRGSAHITGPTPTGAWAGCPNALAIASGDGSFDFKDAEEMRKHLYFWDGVLNLWDGTALAPVAAAGGGGGAALPTGTDGSVLIHDATGWKAFPPPPLTPATYGLRYIVQAGAVPGIFSWAMVAAEDPEGGATRRPGAGPSGPGAAADETRRQAEADREKRASGGGPSVPPSSSTGPKGPSGGAGGGRLGDGPPKGGR